MRYLLVLALVLIACSGKEKTLLHFDGYDISERDMQLEFRAVLARAGVQGLVVCRQFSDMTTEEARNYLSRIAGRSDATPPPGAIQKPGQNVDPKSYDKAVELFLGECKRLG